MDNTKRPIGVFDSGVGGLSVLKELEHLLPNEKFIFLADQLNIPYGEKSPKELINICSKITKYFIKKYKIKMLVVACNTATCYVIDSLREKYFIPIVGTVPAVKKAVENSKTGVIAVISTPSTSRSKMLKDLIKNHCEDNEVFNVSCKNLVSLIEERDIFGKNINILLEKYLKNIKNTKVDSLVLGCTHYPFLKKSIHKYLGRDVKLIDSGNAIAKRTKFLLKQNKLENNKKLKNKTIFLSTGGESNFSRVASRLLNRKIKANKVRI